MLQHECKRWKSKEQKKLKLKQNKFDNTVQSTHSMRLCPEKQIV